MEGNRHAQGVVPGEGERPPGQPIEIPDQTEAGDLAEISFEAFDDAVPSTAEKTPEEIEAAQSKREQDSARIDAEQSSRAREKQRLLELDLRREKIAADIGALGEKIIHLQTQLRQIDNERPGLFSLPKTKRAYEDRRGQAESQLTEAQTMQSRLKEEFEQLRKRAQT